MIRCAVPGDVDALRAIAAAAYQKELGYFATGYTADTTILFRIFHYPPSLPQVGGWGVGEHTDYGLVTLLAQDDSGGLQAAMGWPGPASLHRQLRRLSPREGFRSLPAAPQRRAGIDASQDGLLAGNSAARWPRCATTWTRWPPRLSYRHPMWPIRRSSARTAQRCSRCPASSLTGRCPSWRPPSSPLRPGSYSAQASS